LARRGRRRVDDSTTFFHDTLAEQVRSLRFQTIPRSLGDVSRLAAMMASAARATPPRVVAGRVPRLHGRARARGRLDRVRVPASAESARVIPDTPTVKFDPEVVGKESSHDARIASVNRTLGQWARSIETGSASSLSADATEAAEWVRQYLTLKIETGDVQLPRAQSKIAADGEVPQNLLLMFELGSVHAAYALQALCERNAQMCAKVAKLGAMDAIKNVVADDGAAEETTCAAAALVSTLVSRNDDVHRLMAKSRLVPVILNRMVLSPCVVSSGAKECASSYADFRGASADDYFSATVRDLSHNNAQQKLLIASGGVESMLTVMQSERRVARINAACALANLVGKEEGDVRMEADPTVVEEIVDTLRAALDAARVDGQSFETHKVLKSIASLATNDANKARIADAGALPLLVRALQEPQEAHSSTDAAQFWAATGLWNLAFDEAIRERVNMEPGVVDALEEARRTGSDDTKRKAKGALWMIKGDQASSEVAEVSEETLARLNGQGTVENATGQVMLSYEWRMQSQVLRLRDELMAQGFTVWMDVDRMMGSTLEAMAIAIEQSDAIIMCVTHRYKESQACRTEAEYAYTKKKHMIPVMLEKNYTADGWLGIIMGSKLYYNMHTIDEMQASLPGLVGEVRKVQQTSSAQGANGAAPPAAPAPAAPSADYSGGGKNGSAKKTSAEAPASADAVAVWLAGVGLGEYAEAFAGARLWGKSLAKFHEEIGFHNPADEKYHEKFKAVLGITSYGDRLLLLAELEEMFGEIKWRR
jgi:phosphopantothenate-cysteine ligase